LRGFPSKQAQKRSPEAVAFLCAAARFSFGEVDMSEHDPDSIKRSALLKQIGIAGAGVVAGVVAVEGEADATQHPFNLTIANSSTVKTKQGPSAKLVATQPIVEVEIVGKLSDVTMPASSVQYVFQVPNPYISGSDETGLDHAGEANSKALKNDFFIVIGPKVP
jgi:hypothetical protein